MAVTIIHTPFILCADIGGSHITTAVCDIRDYSVIEDSLQRVEIDCHGVADEILTNWVNTLKQTLINASVTVAGLALAMPGPFDYQEGISLIKGMHKYESLFGLNIKQYLSNELHLDPGLIKFRNDAEATIAGECIAGSGKRFSRIMGITLGTGFGSAFCEQNNIRDLNLGSIAYSGSIADDHFSTRWFAKRFEELTGEPVKNVKELAQLANTRTESLQVFEEFANNVGEFLRVQAAPLQPEVLIVCGNIAKASGLFLSGMQEKMPEVLVVVAELGEHAALIGASALFEIKSETSNFLNVANKI